MFPRHNFPPFSLPPVVPNQQLYSPNPFVSLQPNQMIRQPFVSQLPIIPQPHAIPQPPLPIPENFILPQHLYLPPANLTSAPPQHHVDMSHIMQRVNMVANRQFDYSPDRSQMTAQQISSYVASMIQQAGLDQRDPEFLLKLEPFRKTFISMLAQNGLLNDASPALFEQFFSAIGIGSSHTTPHLPTFSLETPSSSVSLTAFSASSCTASSQPPPSTAFPSETTSTCEFYPPPPPQPPPDSLLPPPPPPVPLLDLSLSPPPNMRAATAMPPNARPRCSSVERKFRSSTDSSKEPQGSQRIHREAPPLSSSSRVPLNDSKDFDAPNAHVTNATPAKSSQHLRSQSVQDLSKDISRGLPAPESSKSVAEVATPGPSEWVRSSPSAPLYMERERASGCLVATRRMIELEDRFEREVLDRLVIARLEAPRWQPPSRVRPTDAEPATASCNTAGDGGAGAPEDELRDAGSGERQLTRKRKKHSSKMPSSSALSVSGAASRSRASTKRSKSQRQRQQRTSLQRARAAISEDEERDGERSPSDEEAGASSNSSDTDSELNPLRYRGRGGGDGSALSSSSSMSLSESDMESSQQRQQSQGKRTPTAKRRHKRASKRASPSESDTEAVGCEEAGEARGKQSNWRRKELESSFAIHDRMREMEAKLEHPARLHSELWFNEASEMNDGPACACVPANCIGPMHNIFAGESFFWHQLQKSSHRCSLESNNSDKLFHYRLSIDPSTNFTSKLGTSITYDDRMFLFEGFSLYSHFKLDKMPPCHFIRYSIPYVLMFHEEPFPEGVTVRSMDLVSELLFDELLSLLDVSWEPSASASDRFACEHLALECPPPAIDADGNAEPTGSATPTPALELLRRRRARCRLFHIFPRFARPLPESGKELLSAHVLLKYLLEEFRPIVEESELSKLADLSFEDWQSRISKYRSMIIVAPGKKPSAIRVDQLDRSMTRASQVPADASDAEAEIQKEDGFLPDTLFPQSTCTSNQNTSSAAASLSSSATKTLEQVSASPNASASVSASASASAGATGSATGTGTGAGSEEQDVKVSNEEEEEEEEEARYPVVVHFALRPLKLTIYREPKYQRLYKQLTKLHYLLMNKRRITRSDRAQLQELCKRLEQYHSERAKKREVAVELSARGLLSTGLKADVCQYALVIPVLLHHLRFQKSIDFLQDHIGYKFKDRSLIQQALTHPSYPKMNFGTNPDHAQNSMTNVGLRQIEYGDKQQLFKSWRKRGLTTLVRIMSYMPTEREASSAIYGNDRLEFLGDAVLEFLVSVHLFFLFPRATEGWLAVYRQAIVQNHHLAHLSVLLGLHHFQLFVHGSDFCMPSAIRHARSDVWEAFMAALYLDGGLELADRILARTMFMLGGGLGPDGRSASEFAGRERYLLRIWTQLPRHPLQERMPDGDREWTAREAPDVFRRMGEIEHKLGLSFQHMRLLARAFTPRNVGFNALTLGDNQRLELLGDTVLKFVTSDYLMRHFPRHHEGHLSLLRSALVNRTTEAIVCDELSLTDYLISSTNRPAGEAAPPAGAGASSTGALVEKRKADLLEALIGALYVDKDLCIVECFCRVCFFPRLVEFILTQDWNDPKSRLQQCCLTLRRIDQCEPDVPSYKVLDVRGPTNSRLFQVGVYFRRKLLAEGAGHSIKEAEMNAARHALIENGELFMQLQFQKRLVTRIQSARPSFSSVLSRAPREQHHRSSSFASVAPTTAPRARPPFIPMPSAAPYLPSTSSIICPAAAARNSYNGGGSGSGSFGIPSLLDLQVARPSARAATAPRPESRPPATSHSHSPSPLLCAPARSGAPQPLLFAPGTNSNAGARSAINSALAGAGPPPPPPYAFRYPTAPFQQPPLSLVRPNPHQYRF